MRQPFLPLERHLPALAGEGWRAALRRGLEEALGISGCRRLLARLGPRVAHGEPVFEAFLDLCQLELDAPGVSEAVPSHGPLVLVANHPFGGTDALAVAALATRARPDFKILANAESLAIPGVAGSLLPLEVLGEPGAGRRNAATLRDAVRHLALGRALVGFPAGAVSHWQ